MKRAALWLVDMVGEGEIFTKEDLRLDFPTVAQIDRRVRDLRSHGWVIHTYSDDPSLSKDEQRLVRIGGHVWERGYVSPTTPDIATPKQRSEALAAANHHCMFCGAVAGESYDDDPLKIAKLTVVRGADEGWLSCCLRCRQGGAVPSSTHEFYRWYERLTRYEKRVLQTWVTHLQRAPTDIDRAWDAYRRLSQEDRAEALSTLLREVSVPRGRHSAEFDPQHLKQSHFF